MGKNGSWSSSGTHNVIAAGTKLTGQIVAGEDLRIDGTIEGGINCQGKIIIGPSSLVTGDIDCANLELMGKINGNITCSDNIVLRNMSQLVGDIKTKTIEIEPGASFTGACSMQTLTRAEK